MSLDNPDCWNPDCDCLIKEVGFGVTAQYRLFLRPDEAYRFWFKPEGEMLFADKGDELDASISSIVTSLLDPLKQIDYFEIWRSGHTDYSEDFDYYTTKAHQARFAEQLVAQGGGQFEAMEEQWTAELAAMLAEKGINVSVGFNYQAMFNAFGSNRRGPGQPVIVEFPLLVSISHKNRFGQIAADISAAAVNFKILRWLPGQNWAEDVASDDTFQQATDVDSDLLEARAEQVRGEARICGEEPAGVETMFDPEAFRDRMGRAAEEILGNMGQPGILGGSETHREGAEADEDKDDGYSESSDDDGYSSSDDDDDGY